MVRLPDSPLTPRIFFGVFSAIFGCIGLTVLVSLWTASGFHAPPLMIRLVGSFIAMGFIAFSCFGIYSAVRGPLNHGKLKQIVGSNRGYGACKPQAADSFACPSCGAGLGAETEISPSGDVKCAHCNNWFNVRGRA